MWGNEGWGYGGWDEGDGRDLELGGRGGRGAVGVWGGRPVRIRKLSRCIQLLKLTGVNRHLRERMLDVALGKHFAFILLLCV